MTEEKSEILPPKEEDVKKELPETFADSECSTGHGASNSRRTGLSKREIMEDLSRQRFPWDE
jgi:hypothetical protein